mgnify:CR=1 FL=1|jgi:hypothetical protein
MKFIDFFRKVDELCNVSDENVRLVNQYILLKLHGVSSKFKISDRIL